MRPRWLVVGAGFTGAVLAERLASRCDAEVLVIDRRSHVAGNAFDARNAAGIRYHAYGPHIFHTNSTQVVDYLSRFTAWTPYEHRILAAIDGQLVPIPFNLTSLALLYPPAEARALTALLAATYGMESRVPILKLRAAQDPALRAFADVIYEKVFRHYTEKQWGLPPEALPSVTARVPVRVSHDDRVFQDTFQKVPAEGYTHLVERILDHPNITVALETRFEDIDSRAFPRIVHTGSVDEFCGYALGELAYRSMRFDYATYPGRRRQPVASINYTMSEAFTRTTEMGWLTQEWGDATTVATEYPGAHRPGETEPHYPIPLDAHQALHGRYLDLAKREAPHIVFAGRLGDYRYYNMDQATARALSLFRRLAPDPS